MITVYAEHFVEFDLTEYSTATRRGSRREKVEKLRLSGEEGGYGRRKQYGNTYTEDPDEGYRKLLFGHED
jgi:hypothetical protein